MKCPEGTTSARKAECLGQCVRKTASNDPVAIINPVESVGNISSLDGNNSALALEQLI